MDINKNKIYATDMPMGLDIALAKNQVTRGYFYSLPYPESLARVAHHSSENSVFVRLRTVRLFWTRTPHACLCHRNHLKFIMIKVSISYSSYGIINKNMEVKIYG